MTELFSSDNKKILKTYLNKLTQQKFNKSLSSYQNLDSLLQSSIQQINDSNVNQTLVEANKKILSVMFVKLKEQENMEKLLSRNYEKTPELQSQQSQQIQQHPSQSQQQLLSPMTSPSMESPLEPFAIASDTLQPNGSTIGYKNDLDSKPPSNVSFLDNSNENLPNASDVYDNIIQQRKREDENIYSTQKKDSEQAMSWLNQNQSQTQSQRQNQRQPNSNNIIQQGNNSSSSHSQNSSEERFILLEQGETLNNGFSFVKTLGFIKSIKLENMILHEKGYKTKDMFGQQQVAKLSDYPYIYVEILINNVSIGECLCFQVKQKNNKIFLSSNETLHVNDLVTKIEFRFFNDKREQLNIEYIVDISDIHIGSTLTKTRKRLFTGEYSILNSDHLKMDYKYIIYNDAILEHHDKIRINDDTFDLLGLIRIEEDDENLNIMFHEKQDSKNTFVIKNTNTIDENTKMEIITQLPKIYLQLN